MTAKRRSTATIHTGRYMCVIELFRGWLVPARKVFGVPRQEALSVSLTCVSYISTNVVAHDARCFRVCTDRCGVRLRV